MKRSPWSVQVFSKALLARLDSVSVAGLNTSETTSYKLLRFVLQDEIDEYTYKMYLNPIQADQGFHLNLNYRIRPINSFEQAVQKPLFFRVFLGCIHLQRKFLFP